MRPTTRRKRDPVRRADGDGEDSGRGDDVVDDLVDDDLVDGLVDGLVDDLVSIIIVSVVSASRSAPAVPSFASPPRVSTGGAFLRDVVETHRRALVRREGLAGHRAVLVEAPSGVVRGERRGGSRGRGVARGRRREEGARGGAGGARPDAAAYDRPRGRRGVGGRTLGRERLVNLELG
jgi:hypothetical protein